MENDPFDVISVRLFLCAVICYQTITVTLVKMLANMYVHSDLHMGLRMLAGLKTSSDRGGGQVGSTLVPRSLLQYCNVRMTAAHVPTVVSRSPADEGLDCIVCLLHTYIATSTKFVCHSCTQQRRSTKKAKDFNWVRKNPQTAKNHSTEREDTPHRSSTVILWLAAWKIYGIRTESMQNFHRIRRILQVSLICTIAYTERFELCKLSCDYHVTTM